MALGLGADVGVGVGAGVGRLRSGVIGRGPIGTPLRSSAGPCGAGVGEGEGRPSGKVNVSGFCWAAASWGKPRAQSAKPSASGLLKTEFTRFPAVAETDECAERVRRRGIVWLG